MDVTSTLSLSDLGVGILAALAYTAVGLALLALGYVVLDKLTPGKLGELIYTDHNVNAARIAMAHLGAITLVIAVAALTGVGGLFGALLDTAVFGVIGIALQALTFKVVDALTPGDLGAIVCDPKPNPASTVTAAISIAVGVVIAVAVF